MRTRRWLSALLLTLLALPASAGILDPFARRIKRVAALPATCAVSDIAFRTSDGTVHYCSATNTWTEFSAGGGGDTLPIADSTGVVKGSADATKIVRIEADGITTGTTRVLTMPDANVDLGQMAAKNAANTFTTAQLIQPATDVAGLTVRAHASATANILQIQDSGNNPLFTVTGAGVVSAPILGGTVTGTYTLGGTPTFPTTVPNLADPNADRLTFWDDSAGAFAHLTLGTNLTITGTTIDAAGGDPFADPGADRIVFWDDSATDFVPLSLNANLAISGTELNLGSTISGISTIDGVNITASTATTPAVGDNDTSLATTAFVQSAAAGTDPTLNAQVIEDFAQGSGTPPGFNYLNSGAGTGWSQTTTPMSASEFGVQIQSTGTTATGVQSTRHWHAAVTAGGGQIITWVKVRFPTLSDGTETYTWSGGLIDDDAGDPTDGIFFRYTHSVNAGEFEGVVCQGGVCTACDSNVAVAANTWYSLKSVTNTGGTSTEFFINGSTACTNGNTHPSAGDSEWTGVGIKMEKSAGTTARTAIYDYLGFRKTFSSAR